MSESRFRNLKLLPDGNFAYEEFREGLGEYINSRAGFSLFLIREAWGNGCSFEKEADGFGLGEGTHGDWSAIRDSSHESRERMLEKALNHLFG